MALLGQIFAQSFAGIGQGLAQAGKEQDARIAEERKRRDELLQRAQIFAQKDKDKYDAAKENNRERVALIDSRLAQYSGMFGSDQERLAAAANIAKRYTNIKAAETYLDSLDENYANSRDTVSFEFASNIDKKALENLSLERVAGQLVPEYMRPKSFETYYSPTEYQTDSLLFRGMKTPKSLQKQGEEAAQIGRAMGLDEDYGKLGTTPEVGLPTLRPKLPDTSLEKIMNTALSKLKEVEKSGGDVKAATIEYKKAEEEYLDFYARKAAASSTDKNTLGYTPAFINTKVSDGQKNPYYTFAQDPALLEIYSITDVKLQDSAPAAVKSAAGKETAYQLAARAIQQGSSITGKDAMKVYAGSTGTITEAEIGEALRVRGNRSMSLSQTVQALKRVDMTDESFSDLSVEYQALARALQTNNVEDGRVALNKVARIGFFVPKDFRNSTNFTKYINTIFAKPLSST